MYFSFDINKFVGSLPGGLIFGNVVHETSAFNFSNDSVIVPQRRLSDFMKILECLSKNIVLEEKDATSIEMEWGNTKISLKGKLLEYNSFSLLFDLSTCLAFLIAVRKVTFWIVAPTEIEFEFMDIFTRQTIKNSVGFPKISQMEEEIKTVLVREMNPQRKFYVSQFLINHHALLEFQYNLYLLTTK